MFNPTFIKYLRKQPLLLADSLREEGSQPEQNKLTRFATNLESYYVTKRYNRLQVKQHGRHIAKYYKALRKLDDNALNQQFYQAINALNQQKRVTHHLAKAFACIGEAIHRRFGFYPHAVQYLGAYVLLQGKMAEMQTGEGKTIVAGMAATLAAATGAAVHVLSTNDYLATRDQQEMQPLFEFYGLTSGAIDGEMEIPERQTQYQQAICYVSASELVFDVLKDELNADNRLTRKKSALQRFITTQASNANLIVPALHFCIVDEADSVLIDEASTPLIISQEAESLMDENLLRWALVQAKDLRLGHDFTLDHTNQDVNLAADVVLNDSLPLPSGLKPMWSTRTWQNVVIKKALTALHLFNKDEHYIVLEDKVVIVDESTGRPMPDRSWEQGLHQLIEIKENVEVSKTRQTIAQITFQRFFRRYILLSGLTGTVTEVSREMWKVYGLKVCVIPPNRRNKRKTLPRDCHRILDNKWQAVANEAIKRATLGQPVLIGTRSVEASERVYELLNQALHPNPFTLYLLNARQNAEEADIVAKAGISGTITIATNMAGRGTDIKLDDKAKQSGGLHVILTEHHDSTRIDRQLIGRSARQGNAGSFREIVCFNDAILLSHRSVWQMIGRWMPTAGLRRWFYNQAIIVAQRRAQQRQYEIRMNTLKQDNQRQKQIGFIGKLR
jgi:preprotein translocase subunit SecA